jgi:hypothetical protein
MSEWSDRVKNHPVWAALESFGPTLDQALSREGMDSTAVEGLTRLKTILGFVGKRLAESDSFLLPVSILDAIQAAIVSANGEIVSFSSDGNIEHISTANGQGDTALNSLARLNFPSTKGQIGALREAADVYRAALGQSIKQSQALGAGVNVELENVKSRTIELATEIQAERQRLTTLVSEHQSQFSLAQERRNREHTEAQSTRQERFAVLLNDYTSKLADQNAEFTVQRDTIGKEHDSLLEELTTTYKASAQSILDAMESRKGEIENLVGVIGEMGMTSGYQRTANEARWTTRFWQLVALAGMVTLVVVAYKSFLPAVEGQPFTWESFAGRVFISLTIGVLAAYAASQADKYQHLDAWNRRLALELGAMGPFIAPLSPEKQEEFRLTVGERSFGAGEGPSTRFGGKSPATLVDVLMESKELRELIIGVIKANKV